MGLRFLDGCCKLNVLKPFLFRKGTDWKEHILQLLCVKELIVTGKLIIFCTWERLILLSRYENVYLFPHTVTSVSPNITLLGAWLSKLMSSELVLTSEARSSKWYRDNQLRRILSMLFFLATILHPLLQRGLQASYHGGPPYPEKELESWNASSHWRLCLFKLLVWNLCNSYKCIIYREHVMWDQDGVL